MTGNIISTANDCYAGGIAGVFAQTSGSTVHSFMNYITGDIINTVNVNRVGGLVALANNSNVDLTTSINAMNGNVNIPVIGTPSTGSTVATVDETFGLIYTTAGTYSTTTAPAGLATDPDTGLPVFDLTATDPDSVVLTFEFVFGNLPPPVVWVLDANSKYEISSKEHLIQLMNSGALYTNEGSTPTDWTRSSYIQTRPISTWICLRPE